MPDIVNARNVQITIPSGVVKSLPNPLLTYTFQTFPLNKTYFPTIQSPSDNDYYLARYNHTVRNPDSLGAESDYDAANMVLASDQLQYRTVSTQVQHEKSALT
jgi:tyrosinase